MYSLGEINSFVLNVANLSPSSNLLMNAMLEPEPDLPYATVPWAPHSDGKNLFGLRLYLAGRCSKNPQSARGPGQLFG